MSKKAVSVLSACVGLVLAAAVAGIICSTLSDAGMLYGPTELISAIVLTMTAAFGIYYIISGCKKGRGSRYYVCYIGALAVCDIVMLLGMTDSGPLGIVCCTVSAFCCVVLCFAKDLGQKRSAGFAFLALAAKLIVLMLSLSEKNVLSMNLAAGTVLSAAALFMVGAKYYDKTSRGSK